MGSRFSLNLRLPFGVVKGRLHQPRGYPHRITQQGLKGELSCADHQQAGPELGSLEAHLSSDGARREELFLALKPLRAGSVQ